MRFISYIQIKTIGGKKIKLCSFKTKLSVYAYTHFDPWPPALIHNPDVWCGWIWSCYCSSVRRRPVSATWVYFSSELEGGFPLRCLPFPPRPGLLCFCKFLLLLPTGPSNVFKIVKMIMERIFQPVIIFSFSKKDCEAYALQMTKLDFNTGKNNSHKHFYFTALPNMFKLKNILFLVNVQ